MNAVDVYRSRRQFLTIAAVGTLTACGAAPARANAPSASPTIAPSSPIATPTAAASTAAAPTLPHPALWAPNSGDLEPAAKLTAARYIERIGTGSTRRVQVIEAQYGGLLTSSASVLVVCRSWTLTGGRIVEGGHTFDVRLVRRSSGWSVIAAYPSAPGAPITGLTAAARHVLASRRIVLPPAAHADIAAGQVHDSVLETMLQMSLRWIVGVSVVRSGHPIYVFGTNRLSDHPRGRAFDTWQIDGHAVVSPSTSRGLIIGYMEHLASLGSYNVGGPVLLGSAPQYFSDRTHHDHVHAGFLT